MCSNKCVIIILQFSQKGNNEMSYVLLIVSFVICWAETWFLDFKVLPREQKARERGNWNLYFLFEILLFIYSARWENIGWVGTTCNNKRCEPIILMKQVVFSSAYWLDRDFYPTPLASLEVLTWLLCICMFDHLSIYLMPCPYSNPWIDQCCLTRLL